MSECDELILLQVSHQDSDLWFHEAHPFRQTVNLVLAYNIFKLMQGTRAEHQSDKACDSAVLTTLSAASLSVHLLATLYNALGHKRQNNAITSFRPQLFNQTRQNLQGRRYHWHFSPKTNTSSLNTAGITHIQPRTHFTHTTCLQLQQQIQMFFYSRSEARKDLNAAHLYQSSWNIMFTQKWKLCHLVTL